MKRTYFEPHPKQERFIEAVFNPQYRICGYGGGIRSGKSYVCCAALILLHKLYPKSRSIVIRETLPTIKMTTIPTFKKVCPPEFIESWNLQTETVTFRNGSELIFKGEDISHDPDLDKFKGLEVNWAFLEQMEELSETTLQMMIMRTGTHRIPKMPQAKIFYTINPSNTWVRQYCYDRFTKGILPSDHFYLPALVQDNPTVFNDKNYMDGLESTLDKMSRARYVEGNWDAFKGKNPFAYAFNEAKHTAEHLEQDLSNPIYLSFDFNHAPMTCTIWQHDDNKIRCLKEVETNEGLIAICAKLKNIIGWENNELKKIAFVTGDRSGWSKSPLVEGSRTAYDIIQNELNLTAYQIKTPQINPSILKSRELVNSILEKHKDFLIDRTQCPNLIYDLKFVESDDEHDIVKDRNKQAGKADYLDCFLGDTKIITDNGEREISKIELGENVLTSNGFHTVIDKWDSSAEVYEFTLTDGTKINCTKDHLFYNSAFGFLPIFTIFTKNIELCQVSNTAEDCLLNIQSKNISTPTLIKRKSAFTERYGQINMEQYQRDMTSIIKTEINLITRLITLNVSKAVSIANNTQLRIQEKIQNVFSNLRQLAGSMQKSGMVVKMELLGINNTLRIQVSGSSIMEMIIANIAGSLTGERHQEQDSVPTIASQHGEGKTSQIRLKEIATNVARNTKHLNTCQRSFAQSNVSPRPILTGVKVKSCRKIGIEKVYDITVDKQHEFFANKILAHNCLRYYLNTFHSQFIKL